MDGVVDHETRVRSDDEEQGLEGHELVVADRRLLDRRQRRALADDAAHVVADQQARADLRVGADVALLRRCGGGGPELALEGGAQELEVAELLVELDPRVELPLAERVDRRRRQRAKRDAQSRHDEAVDRRRQDRDLVGAAVDALVVPPGQEGVQHVARERGYLRVEDERAARSHHRHEAQRHVEVPRRLQHLLLAHRHLLLARRQQAVLDALQDVPPKLKGRGRADEPRGRHCGVLRPDALDGPQTRSQNPRAP